MRWMSRFAVVSVIATLAFTVGCEGDCEEESCSSWCDGLGEPEDPDRTMQLCVANAGESGGDLILRDEDGEEVFSCRTERNALGEEVSTCVDDFAAEKSSFCGC
jgi:hypothetical protein